jgi:hypothetical protein
MFNRIRNMIHNVEVLTRIPIQAPGRQTPAAAAAPAPAAPAAPQVAPGVPVTAYREVPPFEPDPSCKPATLPGLLKAMCESALASGKLRWMGSEAPVEKEDMVLIKMTMSYIQRLWTLPHASVESMPADQPMIDMSTGKRISMRELLADQAARGALCPAPIPADDAPK